jgi:hypothetical protein
VAGKAPGTWITTGFSNQNEELEAGCFAAVAPSVPSFSALSPIPGALRTDRSLAATFESVHGRVTVVGRACKSSARFVEGGLYQSTYNATRHHWLGPSWSEVLPGGMRTDFAAAVAAYGGDIFVFALRRPDGVVVCSIPTSANPMWGEVPSPLTATSVATVAADGALVVCARGAGDDQLYVNQLASSPGEWSGWSMIPAGRRTIAAPALAWFQDDLYVLARSAGRSVLAKAQVVGGHWTDWAEVPSGGQTTSALAVATGVDGQLYVFMKGAANPAGLFMNVASDTGTWNGRWKALGGTTNTAPAAAAGGGVVYVFAVDAGQVPVMRMSLK